MLVSNNLQPSSDVVQVILVMELAVLPATCVRRKWGRDVVRISTQTTHRIGHMYNVPTVDNGTPVTRYPFKAVAIPILVRVDALHPNSILLPSNIIRNSSGRDKKKSPCLSLSIESSAIEFIKYTGVFYIKLAGITSLLLKLLQYACGVVRGSIFVDFFKLNISNRFVEVRLYLE
jgi:hypothetical protein